jgi:thiosulfate/3-mercaptopyruvate sulfurtransferase
VGRRALTETVRRARAAGGGGALSDVELEELSGRLGDVPVFDVRSAHEYSGAFGKPCDPRQGHIPGARHLDLGELLGLTEDAVRERVALPPGSELVVYCHSGSRSALAAEVLRRLGYEARNYAGSWHEWSRTDLPIDD